MYMTHRVYTRKQPVSLRRKMLWRTHNDIVYIHTHRVERTKYLGPSLRGVLPSSRLVHPFPRRLAAAPPPSHPLHFALDGCITIDSSTTLVTGALPYYDSKGKQAHTRDEEEEARRWWWQGAGEGEGCGGEEEEDEDGEEV